MHINAFFDVAQGLNPPPPFLKRFSFSDTNFHYNVIRSFFRSYDIVMKLSDEHIIKDAEVKDKMFYRKQLWAMEACEHCTVAHFHVRKSLPALKALIQEPGIGLFLLQNKENTNVYTHTHTLVTFLDYLRVNLWHDQFM